MLKVVGSIERGNVQSPDLCQGGVQFVPRAVTIFPGPNGFDDFQDDFFPFSDDESVDEVRHWLGVVGAMAARDHDRIQLSALRGQHRNSSQVQHIEGVRVQGLVRQRDG